MPDHWNRWDIKNDKWVEKPGGGYRVKAKGPPTTVPEVADWILDMIDWGEMVREDLKSLRAEVQSLRSEVAQHTQSLKEIESLKRGGSPTATP